RRTRPSSPTSRRVRPLHGSPSGRGPPRHRYRAGVRILVLGSGAREHAIVNALLAEPAGHEVIAAPGNAGIAAVAETVGIDQENGEVVAGYAVETGVDLVVVGPEAPLVAGVADAVRAAGVP